MVFGVKKVLTLFLGRNKGSGKHTVRQIGIFICVFSLLCPLRNMVDQAFAEDRCGCEQFSSTGLFSSSASCLSVLSPVWLQVWCFWASWHFQTFFVPFPSRLLFSLKGSPHSLLVRTPFAWPHSERLLQGKWLPPHLYSLFLSTVRAVFCFFACSPNKGLFYVKTNLYALCLNLRDT